MASTYTTTFHLEKPEYKVLRFDIPINADLDALDAALKNFPNAAAVGQPTNHPEVTITEGVMWRDTTNHILKVYTGSAWAEIMTSHRPNMLTQVSAPTANTDKCYIYGFDQAAGNCCPHILTENNKIVKLYQQAHIADLKVDYTTGDLDTEAEIISAVNATNAKINALLAVFENNGFLAAS